MSDPTQQEAFQEIWQKAQARWEQALSEYHQKTGKNLKHPDTPNFDSVDDFGKWIDHHEAQFDKDRNAGSNFFGAVKTALLPLNLITNLLGGAASAV